MVAIAADGGGNLAVDYAALAHAATVLADAGETLDGCGATTPPEADQGDAAALVAAMLAAFTDTAAQVVAETSIIGAAVEACASGLASSDADQAVAVLTAGNH